MEERWHHSGHGAGDGHLCGRYEFVAGQVRIRVGGIASPRSADNLSGTLVLEIWSLAGAYQGKLTVAKMNVDENREIPAKFGIRGIPTLMLFKDGQLAATKVGAMSKAQLTAFIDQQLA